MKQIIQNYRNGDLKIREVPTPGCGPGSVLVRNDFSLISLGTESSIIQLAQKSLLGKARARPDLVRRFFQKVESEGLVKTYKEAMRRLDTPVPLGYSSAGVVVEAGARVNRFSPGDRVACIGAGYASHAQYVSVPENLCCLVPEGLPLEEASFGMLGVIALHGIRCAKVNPGECVVVTGLGLLGLLTVQMLKAFGNRVIGMDIDPGKVAMACQMGAEQAVSSDEELRNYVNHASDGHGADAIIITAATKSDGPVNTAVDLARFAGRIVVVGVADIHPLRNEMWHKEVEIIVSRAGGPGSLDPVYENKGIDYPMGYVRWTENRNLQEFLRLCAGGEVRVGPLISHRIELEQAENTYADMMAGRGGPYVGVVINYPEAADDEAREIRQGRVLSLGGKAAAAQAAGGAVGVGVIGAGLFGRSLLLPALEEVAKGSLKTIATQTGSNAEHMAKAHGFARCTTDYRQLLEDPEIGAVLILTPHSTHARMVEDALRAGKHVFVEKPLCLDRAELEGIKTAYAEACATRPLYLMVGYNRRFSPHAAGLAQELADRKDPMVVNCRVNAGFVPKEHWVHSSEEGGSRVIGEMCHFVDLLQFFTGSDPVRVYAERFSGNDQRALNSDNVTITLKFGDGSVGSIVYSASGDRSSSRERVEIFCEGKSLVLEDFRRNIRHVQGKKKTTKTSGQQMGYREELQNFLEASAGKVQPQLTVGECFTSTTATFAINQALETGMPVDL